MGGLHARTQTESVRTVSFLLVPMLAACDPTIRLGAFGVEAGAVDAVDAVFDARAPNLERAVDAPDAGVARVDAGFDGADAAKADGEIVGADAQGPVVWSATFETGDISEWTADSQGFRFGSMNSAFAVTTDQAHAGSQSVKLTISPMGGNLEYTYLVRGASGAPPAAPEAYYGAWFFIPLGYTESFYWNILHFLESARADRSNSVPIWDVDLRSNERGELVPYVWDFAARQQRDAFAPTPVPIGAWFHLEVLLRIASTPTGRFALFQDGVLVLDVPDVVTSGTPWIQWAVGSVSTDITPTPADLYVDDVTVRLP